MNPKVSEGSVASGLELRSSGSTIGRRVSGLRLSEQTEGCKKWEFPKIGDPYFGVLIIGILPFRVVY